MALAPPAAGVALATTRVTSPDGSFAVVLDGRVRPRRLGAKVPTPMSVRFSSQVAAGETPPAVFPRLREFNLEADRHVNVDVGDLPVCRVLGLPVTPPPWHHCERGVVGRGKMTVLYSIPEGGSPPPISSELVVYNGGLRKGMTNLWVRAYLPFPRPNTSLTRMKVKRVRDGRYGLEMSVSPPRLAAGLGSLVSFDLTLNRKILSATCPDGHLNARGSAFFEKLAGEVELPFASTSSCTPISR